VIIIPNLAKIVWLSVVEKIALDLPDVVEIFEYDSDNVAS